MHGPFLVALILAGNAPQAAAPSASPAAAREFVQRVNRELRDLTIWQSTADWVHETYITDDTERNDADVNDHVAAYETEATNESRAFDGLPLDPVTRRMLYLLRITPQVPAPLDPAKRREMTSLSARLASLYGAGRYCGKDGRGPCRDLLELEEVLDHSHDYAQLLDAWVGWRTIARPMRPLFARLMELANLGARDIGYRDLGEFWRAGYDMSPEAFEGDVDRLWAEVRPFYEDLHCYVRRKLVARYGKDKVPEHGPIPAHLLGNMWAQEWGNLYPLVEPYPGQGDLDVTASLKRQGYDRLKLVRLGEGFFRSLGFGPLPDTFWSRSLFEKPLGREVVCHPSAWDVTLEDDLRLKACLRINEEDLVTVHHELGHLYYYRAYEPLPVLFQRGANDGFHEAIGDAIALSITPRYLAHLGLLSEAGESERQLIDVQMKEALDRVAFLPFSLLVDKWRWDVARGRITPRDYTRAWWDYRLRYQGVAPPVARGEAEFDPGAKYHVAASVPYARYFLARILQFQFHRALCRAAGDRGPLHSCSIYGSREAGRRLQAMLSLGASRPWPEALEVLTGERRMDSSALLEYFAPLRAWLRSENRGQACGWSETSMRSK